MDTVIKNELSLLNDNFNDLESLLKIESSLILTNDSNNLIFQLSDFDINLEDELNSETAINKKNNMLEKINSLKNNIIVQIENRISNINSLSKTSKVNIESLKNLLLKINNNDIIPNKDFNKEDVIKLNNKLGFFNNLGLDINKVEDVIKLILLPNKIMTEIIPENTKILKIIDDTFFANIDNIAKNSIISVQNENGKIVDKVEKAKKSIELANSLKFIDFKKSKHDVRKEEDGTIEIYSWVPYKVFCDKLSFCTLYFDKGKTKTEIYNKSLSLTFKTFVEIDTIENKEINLKEYSKENIIKIIEAGIKELENNDKNINIVINDIKKMLPFYKRNFFFNNTLNNLITLNFTRLQRYKNYYFQSSKNLINDFYEINYFIKDFINIVTTSKK